MDWITLVLFLLFFLILPLLEALGKKRRPPDLELPHEEGEPSGGWSEEWEQWPFEAEKAERETAPPERRAPAAPRSEPRRTTRPAPSAEPARDLGEEPSLDSFLAPSDEEIERSSRKLRARRTTFPQAREARRARLAVDRSARGKYLSRLRTREGFREAFILSEILAPPKSMRGDDDPTP